MFLGSVLNVISAEQRVLGKCKYLVYFEDWRDAPFNVEAENLDAIIIFAFYSLFASVEFLSLVDIFATSIASPRCV